MVTTGDPIWTPRREMMRAAVRSPVFGLIVLSRLLELALSDDGKVAIEALKLLLGRAPDSGADLDSELLGLPVEQLQEAMDRAKAFILGAGTDRAGDHSAGAASAGAEVLRTLRKSDYAKLPGSSPSPADNGGAATGGVGDDHEVDRFDAPQTWEE